MALQRNKLGDRSFMTRIKDIPEALLENRITAFAGLCAAAAGLLPDPFKAAYWIIFPIFILLCIFGTWYKLREKCQYLETAIAIPIVIKIASTNDANNALDDLFASIGSHYNLPNYKHNLAKYLHIDKEDLLFEYGSDNRDIFEKERLKRFFAVVKYGINHLQRRAPQASFYLAFIGPTSVAIAIGTILNQIPVTIFHYDKDSRKYFPTIATNRKLREKNIKLKNFKLTDIDGQSLDAYFDLNNNAGATRKAPWQEKVTIVIQVSTHGISVDDDKARYGDIIYMRDQSNGTIDVNKPEEWEQRCREIYKVANDLIEQYGVKEICLIYSMPVALGIALGICLQSYWKIALTNYNKEQGIYEDVIYLNELNIEF